VNAILDEANVDLQTLTLVPEPDNKVDKYAVRVMSCGKHIGYVKRDYGANRLAREELSHNDPLTVKVHCRVSARVVTLIIVRATSIDAAFPGEFGEIKCM